MTTQDAVLDAVGSLRRTHGCGLIKRAEVGEEVVVAGWVHRRRDHGGVIFVDLRDRYGITQVRASAEIRDPGAFWIALRVF